MSALRAALLIPNFDHGEGFREVIASLSSLELPCLVIDDGSDAATRGVLDAVEAEFDWVQVHHRKQNGGKGAALKTGYRLAAERGFSHVVQLDADGQHDVADVPRFLEIWREDPDAVVLGEPIFDESVPRGRLYGRQISRFFVWLFTLSFEIPDPLCGFRGLPLERTLRVIDGMSTGDRMEFDPELLVRLHWDGASFAPIATKVRYDPDGVSHFDVVWDDVRLAGVYSRFLGAMVPRVPSLLARTAGRAWRGSP